MHPHHFQDNTESWVFCSGFVKRKVFGGDLKKLLDQVRETLQLHQYAPPTPETYMEWIRQYLLFHHTRHPQELNAPKIEVFLL